LKDREELGSSLPPIELAKMKCIFEKMKCIFSIAPMGNLQKSWECFLLRNTHRTLAQRQRMQCLRVRCAVYFKVVRVRHRTLSIRRRSNPVGVSGAA